MLSSSFVPGTYGSINDHRMDRRDLEPRHRLHQNQPGCDHCYAERFSERFRGVPGHPFETGFDLTLRPETRDPAAALASAAMIFVNSMSDLFHKAIPKAFLECLRHHGAGALAHVPGADEA